MIDFSVRAQVSRLAGVVGTGLARVGFSPNAVTVLGTVGSVASACWFFPTGRLLPGALVVGAFLLLDVLDGAMARAENQATRFGGVLDATCDRIADGAVFGSLVWWALVLDGSRGRGLALLICLVGAQVISYVRARAEANGLVARGGIAERAVRSIVVLVGVGLHGLGVPHVLDIAVWSLAFLVALTVAQRMLYAARDSRE